ncbi:MAG TPA: ABC transporter permease [Candidatus Sulfotelmatobacter sp.]|nr:ABC transporter permease [Candidatus Sulfotelmatobacter sp.]
MKSLWQDIRFGLRVLAKSPGFTATAVLTLALGIGANTAVFTVVYGVVLRPLPLPQPDRIVQLAETYKDQTGGMSLTATQLRRLGDYSAPFQYVAGITEVGYNLAVGNNAVHLRGMPAGADYFRVLGIAPEIGRDFVAADDAGEGQHVAIVTYNLWQHYLAADPNPIGKPILLNGEPFTVIGVMPRSFPTIGQAASPDSGAPDVWTPIALVAKTMGSGENIDVLARLKAGLTPAELAANNAVILQDFHRESPEDFPDGLRIDFLPYQRMIGLDVRVYLFVLLGAIGFVLLIACANVANLLLARGGLRGREIAVRISLGASPRRIVRLLLVESMLVAIAGGLFGLLVAALGMNSLLALAPVDLPRANDVHLDAAAFAFAFFVALLTGALFGTAPALDATRVNLSESLKEGVGRSSASPVRTRLRKLLVVGEFAVSLVLLTGAGLMIATFSRLLHTDPGFNPHPVLSMEFWMTGSRYTSTAQVANFNRALVARLESIPGVEAAGVVSAGLPLERGGNNGIKLIGSSDTEWHSVDYREITADYFGAMGITMRDGRKFSEGDTETTARVTIINEAFARQFFPQRSPIGEQIALGGKVPTEIVGVVRDVKSYLDQPAPPTTFIPAAQASFGTSQLFEGWFPRTVVVRVSTGNGASGKAIDPLSLNRAVRDAFAEVDPLIPTGSTRSMEQVLSRSLALRNFMRLLLSAFASLALLLAAIGIYGVISYAVSQRTREIGVRMALGATPAGMLRLILSESLQLILFGVVIGVAAALGLTRMLASMLYGISSTDPLIFVMVTMLLVVIALAACLIPARRAMRIDPMVALRHE